MSTVAAVVLAFGFWGFGLAYWGLAALGVAVLRLVPLLGIPLAVAAAGLLGLGSGAVQGAAAAVMGIESLIRGELEVRPLQELHAALRPEA